MSHPATSFDLRPYQIQALDSVANSFFRHRTYRQLVVLPTGMGKTVVFSAARKHGAISEWLETYPIRRQKILVLAHREELINQAADKISKINPELIVEIEKAGQKASPMSDVIVASVQTLKGKRLAKIDPNEVRIIIVDEAHHATSPSYTDIIEHFGLLPPATFGPPKPETSKPEELMAWQRLRLTEWDQHAASDRLLLGFTATPRRSDNVGLEAVFQDVVYSKTIRDGIEEGYLSRIRAIRVSSKTSLDGVKTTAGDFNQGDLDEAVNTEERNVIGVKAWLEHAFGLKTVAFCASVQHAKDLAAEFDARGISARSISGVTPPLERRQILQDYHLGKFMVLTNCQLLTEGFDEPGIQCVLHMKPTKSSIQYIQMTGRGTRIAEGKESCLVIDLVDVTRRHSLITAADLFGLPAGFDGKGEDLLDVAKRIDEAKEENPGLKTTDLRSLDELEMRVQEIDIWTSALQSEIVNNLNAKLTWLQDGDAFRLTLPTADKTIRERVEITQNTLGQWEAKFAQNGKTSVLSASGDLKKAFASAEKWVDLNRPNQAALHSRTAPWRGNPPSSGQISYARALKVPEDVLQRATTSGEVSALIDIAKSRRPQKPAAFRL